MFRNFKDSAGTPEYEEMEKLWVSTTENIHPFMCSMADCREDFPLNNNTMDAMLEHLKYWKEMKEVLAGKKANIGSVIYMMDKMLSAASVVMPSIERFKEEAETNAKYKKRMKVHAQITGKNISDVGLNHLSQYHKD